MFGNDRAIETLLVELLNTNTRILQQLLDERTIWRNDHHALMAVLAAIEKLLTPRAVKITITFDGGKPGMAGQMTDTQSISATITETDAAGQPVTFDPAKITWSIADPTIASLTQNPDGSATFKALKSGSTSVSVTDSGPNLSATDTLTVTGGTATTLQLVWGTPQ